MKALTIAVLVLTGCQAETPADSLNHAAQTTHLMSPAAVEARFATGTAQFDGPVQHVGFRMDGAVVALEFRARRAETWTRWQPVEVTWSEGKMHVARVRLGAPASAVELRGAQGLTALTIELSAGLPHERPLARTLPRVQSHGVLQQHLAPRDLVIPRAEWGARDPGKICGAVVAPYRLSVHHTAVPEDDGGDAAARMRQMQAFHIDTRGWCDIGYHFVVSQGADAYQGRSDERRPGAHVLNQNDGNIGISLIGDFDQHEVNAAQFAKAAEIMGWAVETYDIPVDRASIKGHQEWPGQGTSCPGANLLRRLDELITVATGEEPDPPPPVEPTEADVRFGVRWLQTPGDRVQQGSSGGVPDGFEGEAMRVEFTIQNASPSPIRGVRLGYIFGPGWRPTHYTIETDHPNRDRMTWMINDADTAPENPAKDAMGSDGALTMYAFGAGETKRAVVDLEVGPYGPWRTPVQAWVANVDGVYAQAAFGEAPSVDGVGVRLQGEVVADFLARDEWRFPAPEPDDVEGWSACPDTTSPTQTDGVMTVSGCAKSPRWMAIDADRWDALALRLDTLDGPLVLQWVGGSAEVDAEVGGGPVVIDLRQIPEWAGEIAGLRLIGDLEVDALWPQSLARQESGSAIEPFAADPPTEARAPAEPLPILDAAVFDAGLPDALAPTLDGFMPNSIDGGSQGDSGAVPQNGGDGGGCSQTPGPPAGLFLLLLALRRRR